MLKKILTYTLLSLFIMSSVWNAYYSVINFIATNLSIRESFYFTNEVEQKGTHWGGENYRLKVRQHKLELVKLKYMDVLTAYDNVKNIDLYNSKFIKEFQLISLLFEIEGKSNSYKRETALYIPKIFDVYWNLSCDSHMPSFVAPAITNMAMIEGLPIKDSSCYKHFLDYGYNTYYLLEKNAVLLDMTQQQICERAKKEGFKRVIKIYENDGKITAEPIECSRV